MAALANVLCEGFVEKAEPAIIQDSVTLMMLGRYAQPTGAHIPEARSVSLDASRHNSTLTKILDEPTFRGVFVTFAPLFLAGLVFNR